MRILMLIIAWPTILLSQIADSSLLTLERIFTRREFRAERVGPTQWLDDGKRYSRLERSENIFRGRDLVVYDPEIRSREILITADRFIAPGDSLPMRISDYKFSTDRKKLLLFTNTARVWRYNTRGDYWVLNLENWVLHKLGGQVKPSSLMFATFSPRADKVAYVRENNIYVEDLQTKKITALTTSGSEKIINGTFDWVYEEELDLRNGFRWSPDGEKIAYWQMNTEGIGIFHMINNTDSIYSFTIPVQYPKVGTTNASCRVGVVNIRDRETIWFDVPGDPRNNYIARMEWAASSTEIIIQQLNRQQNTNRVMLGDAESGNVRTIFTDSDSAWVEVVDDLNWLNNGKEFSWVSERDGWRHVYRISRDGKSVTPVTTGDYDVVEIENIDDNNGWLYFIASPDNPGQRFLYRMRLDGTEGSQRLTPQEFSGTNSYNISPNSK